MRKDNVSETARPRGRPHKESKDAATDLQRARVRRAQKAYRSRKEAHVSAIEQKCKELEKIVDEMTSEFVTLIDELMQRDDVEKEAVGPLLRKSLRKFLDLGRKAAREPGSDDNSDDGDGDGGPEKEDIPEQEKIETAQAPQAEEWQLPDDLMELITPSLFPSTSSPGATELQLLNDTTYMAPVTKTSDWPGFDPYANNLWNMSSHSWLAVSVVPYLLAGRDSFASRLYFETISLATQSLSGAVPWVFAQSMFRFKIVYVPREQLFRALATVLNMLLQGTTSIKFQGQLIDYSDVVEEYDVKEKIVRILERAGRREEEFLNTWHVERYLRERWRLNVDSQAVRVQSGGREKMKIRTGMLAPTMVPGFVEKEQVVLNTEPLLNRLKELAVTIGEGPRWYLGDIDAVVKMFLRENNVSAVML